MWRTDSSEENLMLGKIGGRKRRGRQRMRCLDGITNSRDMNLSKLREIVKGSHVCYSSWGCRESDMTWWLNNNNKTLINFAIITDWRSWSWMVLWRPTRAFRTDTQKRCPFHDRGLECTSRKSRNTWSNRQIWPWNAEWSRAKTNRVLQRKCTAHSKHLLSTTQEKTLHMDITRWSTPKSDWLYSLQPKMEKLYTGSKNKTRSWLWLRSWTPYCQIQTEIEERMENH